jgi:EmrB/QacA subfamily drug resistance transporter
MDFTSWPVSGCLSCGVTIFSPLKGTLVARCRATVRQFVPHMLGPAFSLPFISNANSANDIPFTMPSPTYIETPKLDTVADDCEAFTVGRPLEDGMESSIHVSPVEIADGGNAAASRSEFRITMILVACLLSLFIAALDVTIVATAVPTITSELNSPAGYAWIGGAYLIATAAGAPIWAKLSDIWGRKIILLAAVALFMGSSIVCALAVNMTMLITGRAIQGAAGGGLIMLVNIVISDVFSMRRRSLFLGLCEAIWAIAGASGPILGGLLVDKASWRWCWWINLPCCVVAFVILLFFLDVHNPRTPFKDGIKAIDWAGSLSILALTIMVLLGLDFGGSVYAWSSPKVICLIVFGALCSVIFIYSEKRLAKYPLMPMALFSERSNVATLLVVFFHGISFIGTEYYLPLYFQSAKEASALKSGGLLAPQIVTTSLMGILSGVVINRTGRYRELIWMGPVILTLGNGLYIHFGSNTSIGEIIGFEVIAGIGSGLQFTPPMVALQALCAQDDIGTTTSTLSFTRAMGLAISVVLGGVVFQNSMNNQASTLRAAGIPANITELLSGRNAAANVMIARSLSDSIQKRAVVDAFSFSLRNLWIMYTGFSFCGIIASLFISKAVLSKEHIETITGLKEKSSN